MALFGNPEGKTVVSMSHGRHCDEEIFYETQEELLMKWGIPSISHTYDVGHFLDPADGKKKIRTVQEHAIQRDKEIEDSGASSSVNMGWSWGANVALWPEMNGIPVIKIMLVAGALHKNIAKWAGGSVPEAIHDVRYDAYERNPGPEAFREISKTHIFTGNETEEVKEYWAKKMRDHPRVELESVLTKAPTAPIDYVVLTGDKTTLNQADISKGLSKKADVTGIIFESDHAPMVDKPHEFARMIAKRTLVIKNVPIAVFN